MKKIFIIIAIVIIIIGITGYLYSNYKVNYNIAKISNSNFDSYLNKDIYGSELATIINRAIDNNEQRKIKKNNRGIYIDNNQDSINIEVKMIDNNKTYPVELFARNGIQKFIDYYGEIIFNCKKIEYHNSTNKLKYMLFEQITQ